MSLSLYYSKMDNITSKLAMLEENLQQFFNFIGQKNMILVQSIKKLQGNITEIEKGEGFTQSLSTISETVADIKDGMWFLEFQKVLERFQEKLGEKI